MNYRKLYEEYSKKYDTMKANALKYGQTIADPQKLSREAFRTSFAQKQIQYEAALNRRLDPREVVKEILNEQKYAGTLAQTKALRTAMKKQGYDISWSEARRWGGVKPEDVENKQVQRFWQDVEAQRNAYMASNPLATSSEAARFIAITMFGSPS